MSTTRFHKYFLHTLPSDHYWAPLRVKSKSSLAETYSKARTCDVWLLTLFTISIMPPMKSSSIQQHPIQGFTAGTRSISYTMWAKAWCFLSLEQIHKVVSADFCRILRNSTEFCEILRNSAKLCGTHWCTQTNNISS